jgi:hypothetical protein
MDPTAFARDVCAWLDPNAVGDALLIYQQNATWAQAPGEWTWRSPILNSAGEVGLDHVIRMFLESFRVPPGYVRLLRSISQPHIAPASWEWLAELRFQGGAVFGDFPPGSPPDLVALVRERNAVIRILQAPLQFLSNVVTAMAQEWIPLAGRDAHPRPSLKHSATGELAVFLESVVASRLAGADAVRVAVAQHKGTMNMDYRCLSYAGPYPSAPDRLAAIRELADSYATRWRTRHDAG